AEDGIRDRNVTGVQTCALPISAVEAFSAIVRALVAIVPRVVATVCWASASVWVFVALAARRRASAACIEVTLRLICRGSEAMSKIGRASCRERGKVEMGDNVVM